MKTLFVDLILPLPIPNLFTYRVPVQFNDFVKPGCRAVVPFGKSKLYTGVIRNIHEKAPQHYTARYIDSIIDETPIVNELQFQFWEWIANYYMCTRGEVYNTALPTGLKLSSETRVIANPAFDGDVSDLKSNHEILLEALHMREVMSLSEIADLLEIKTIQPVIKRLLEIGAVLIEEELKERYKPKVEEYVRLSAEIVSEEDLQQAFATLETAPKQLEMLMAFVQMSKRYTDFPAEVSKIALQKRVGGNSSLTKALVARNIFEIYSKEKGRLEFYQGETSRLLPLSTEQEIAFQQIKTSFESKNVVLLNGVTSSGKTEIYSELIKETVDAEKQVLYLLPEIALTTQIIQRLQRYFGDNVAVYHSRFNQSERVELWNLVMENTAGRARIILGARSAMFLPFSNLGLIIVDEEHESSFKQFDPSPRYNARDAAIVLGNMHNARVLLGSATPSVESLYNAQTGKYGYVELTKRFGGVKLPEIFTADLKTETITKKMHSHFTSALLEEIQKALNEKEQVILFQNRRGYSPMWSCETCGWTPQCKKCDVSTTYHKHSHQLVCHYCGSKYNPPTICSACGSPKIKMVGFGTEKIEEEIPIFFPDATVARLDLDSTRSKHAYRNILNDFEQGLIDVLVGTQMVTKGLDFSNVSLVGVLNADQMLNFPDFRANEKAFQLMTQVSGRAGRKQKRGRVIIQTYNVNHWIIQQVIEGDYKAVYKQEIVERRNFGYPPFTRLIQLTLKHKELLILDFAAAEYTKALKEILPETQVLGPEFPSVARVNNYYLKNTIIKISKTKDVSLVKRKITEFNNSFFQQKDFKSVRLVIDVDPI